MNRSDSWCLWCGDVRTAFLQGQQEGRTQPLFMAPPRDGICVKAQVFSAPLYEILGNVYGLANAPRVWSLEVTKRLKGAGYEQHSLDRQLYLFWDTPSGHKAPILLSLAIVYVDDFLLCHSCHSTTDGTSWICSSGAVNRSLQLVNTLGLKERKFDCRNRFTRPILKSEDHSIGEVHRLID